MKLTLAHISFRRRFEMFNNDFRITGKHANYWKDLCELAGNVPDRDQHANFKIFKAYIDAYITCPIIGYHYNRKGKIDNSVQGDAGMLAAIITKRSAELKFVYQIIMLLDEESEPDLDRRIYRAFNFSEKTEEDRKLIAKNMAVFNAYFLGGLEVLHEQFVDECLDQDAYLLKIYQFAKEFYESQDGEALESAINQILSK